MTRLSWLQWAAVSLPIAAGALASRVWAAPYPTFHPSFSPDRPHLDVPIEYGVPTLRFHPDPQRRRPPVLVLDEAGLARNGKLICTWPGGTFDVAQSSDMVLVPLPGKNEEKPEECPGLPIISAAGGFGPAVLYVEFVRRDAASLEARCDGKPCYLDVASLPAGWYEEPSAKESERARRAEIARERKKDPALGKFLDGSKACLGRKDVPTCLAAFVSERSPRPLGPLTEPPAGLPDPGPARARAVIDYLWSTKAKEWVEGCIRNAPTGSLSTIRFTELSVEWLPNSFVACTEDGEWRLFEIGSGE